MFGRASHARGDRGVVLWTKRGRMPRAGCGKPLRAETSRRDASQHLRDERRIYLRYLSEPRVLVSGKAGLRLHLAQRHQLGRAYHGGIKDSSSVLGHVVPGSDTAFPRILGRVSADIDGLREVLRASAS